MLKRLVRPEIARLEAYEWEISNQQIAKTMGLKESQVIRFDLNTSPYSLTTILRDLAQKIPNYPVNEYIDTTYSELPQLAATYTQTDEDMIVIGAGADECLDITAKAFLGVGTEAILPTPTYSMFKITAEIMGAKPREVLRHDDFSVDIPAILDNITPESRMIFLCSPNNPTANATPREDIKLLLEQAQCMVLIDEAYSEFYGKSIVDLTHEFENLIVIRTLSKAFSMAAMRIGFIVANRKTVQILNKVRPPTSVGVFSAMMATAALAQPNLIEEIVPTIIQERTRLQTKLDQMNGIETYPSDTNFLLVRFNKASAKDVHKGLMKKGLIVRDISGLPLLQNCLRFTVRTKDDDDLLLESLEEILEN